MTPLSNLASRLQTAFPDARIEFSEPVASEGVGFLDIPHHANGLSVQWQQKWHFGVSSPEDHGYGGKPADAAARITDLLGSGRKTEPPEITLRQRRAEKKVPQKALAALLGVSQPAVSKLERHVSRMHIASLRAAVQATGGTLVRQACFPDGVVRRIAIGDEPFTRSEPDVAMTAE